MEAAMNKLIDAIADDKGEVSVPKEMLEALNVVPGNKIRFVLLMDGSVIVRARNRSIRELGGILHREGQEAIPIEQMSP